MTVFAVSRFMDILVKKEKPDKLLIWQVPRFEYFDTEADACEFIIKRAKDGCDKAAQALKKSERRLAKCEKKFKAAP